MNSRIELHYELCRITNNAYFQPPETIKLKYPCIIYKLETERPTYADDMIYKNCDCYTVTYITKDPDVPIRRQMHSLFKYCKFDRVYTVDGLNHFVFTLFYKNQEE